MTAEVEVPNDAKPAQLVISKILLLTQTLTHFQFLSSITSSYINTPIYELKQPFSLIRSNELEWTSS